MVRPGAGEFAASGSSLGEMQTERRRNVMAGDGLTTCLWFDTEGEAAARFYTGIFKDAKLGRMSRYSEAGPGTPGTVMTVEFELNGQQFLALNGGPGRQFSEAVS